MKITIVMGFFLPIPPEAGGAVEKSWHRLAQVIARHGHQVTLISRRWKDWPSDEVKNGVRYLRLNGYDHKSKLWQNLLCDFIWSWRVFFKLPAADIVALNTVSLAGWLGLLRPQAGKVVAMPGRMPKGQFKFYRQLARILVPSSPVKNAVIRERPAFASLIKTVGYPIDYASLARPESKPTDAVTITYVGRIHREKGIDLLVKAACILAADPTLPTWKMVICGPVEIPQGGSGSDYLQTLKQSAPTQVQFWPPLFEESDLHQLYRSSHLFCYPSLAREGETFGVSVVEAMAAGAVPIVSRLPCFQDFLTHQKNGIIFDAHTEEASSQLASELASLIMNPALLNTLADSARHSAKRFDFDYFARHLIEDFQQLTSPQTTTPSPS